MTLERKVESFYWYYNISWEVKTWWYFSRKKWESIYSNIFNWEFVQSYKQHIILVNINYFFIIAGFSLKRLINSIFDGTESRCSTKNGTVYVGSKYHFQILFGLKYVLPGKSKSSTSYIAPCKNGWQYFSFHNWVCIWELNPGRTDLTSQVFTLERDSLHFLFFKQTTKTSETKARKLTKYLDENQWNITAYTIVCLHRSFFIQFCKK